MSTWDTRFTGAGARNDLDPEPVNGDPEIPIRERVTGSVVTTMAITNFYKLPWKAFALSDQVTSQSEATRVRPHPGLVILEPRAS